MENQPVAPPTQTESPGDSSPEETPTQILKQISLGIQSLSSTLSEIFNSTPTSDTGWSPQKVDLVKSMVAGINLRSLHDKALDTYDFEGDPIELGLQLMHAEVTRILDQDDGD
jgi:hypothetical protein